MYHTINEFIEEWESERASTQMLLDALTDSSLQQQVSPDDRTLGRIAWHMVKSIPVEVFGIKNEMVHTYVTVPTSAEKIAESFHKISAAVTDTVETKWTDASLKEVHNVFGLDLPLGESLPMIIKHIIHHRGQMTILMRLAGLKVPGVYGLAREEWEKIGLEAPVL